MTTPQDAIEAISPLLLESRVARLREAASQRVKGIAVVLEGLYDAGNRSAVFRSAEAHGLLHTHVLHPEQATKPQARSVSRGAEKWMHLQTWNDTEASVRAMRAQGYRLYAADVEGAVPLRTLDFHVPVAIVFGNEHRGITDRMRDLVDARFTIPMYGLVESYNISVAAGIALHTARQRRDDALGRSGDLTPAEVERLFAAYLIRSAPTPIRRQAPWAGLDQAWISSILPRPQAVGVVGD